MLNRRQLLVSGGVGVALSTASWGQVSKAASRPGRLSLGLHGPTYYSGFCPFLNWQKVAGDYSLVLAGGRGVSGKAAFDAGIYLNSETGEIANPAPPDLLSFSRIFYARPGQGNLAGGYDFSGMKWTIKWDGSGTCFVGGLTKGGSQSIDKAARSCAFRFGAEPGNTWVSFTVTDHSDPPRNIRIYQSQYEANMAAGELFNPDWLAQIRNFGVLRFMDWMATNGSQIADFSQIADTDYFAWAQGLDSTSGYGKKGGTPLAVICNLANLTHSSIHVCIPHLATDDCVQSMAMYFRDHLDPEIVVIFELSNECWNFGFPQTHYCAHQAEAKWGKPDAMKWHGYRAAQCMKIVRDIFETRRRWRGCIAVQTVNPYSTRSALAGIDEFVSGESRATKAGKSVALTDLFNEIAVTGYFGDIQSSKYIENITNSKPAVATSRSHGYRDGEQLKIFVAAGMTELNDTFVTVTNPGKDSFELLGIDSTSFKPFVRGNNYAHPALLFKLMDASDTNHIADSRNNPTKYSYFNRVMAESWLNGISNGFITNISVASLRDKYWPAQKAIADAYGLELTQYEGGLHFVGDVFLSGYGGNRQFTEYLVNTGHTEETAAVYAAMYEAFFRIGGRNPSKFVEGGGDSQWGTWAGMRYIPGDEGNPVWRVVRQANDQ
jgi:hypothetical protein